MTDEFGPEQKQHVKDNLVMVPAAQLEIGMFVAELDRPWIETPFLIQGTSKFAIAVRFAR